MEKPSQYFARNSNTACGGGRTDDIDYNVARFLLSAGHQLPGDVVYGTTIGPRLQVEREAKGLEFVRQRQVTVRYCEISDCVLLGGDYNGQCTEYEASSGTHWTTEGLSGPSWIRDQVKGHFYICYIACLRDGCKGEFAQPDLRL